MVLGHIVFGAHFMALALGFGPQRDKPALFRQLFHKEAAA
jgi:cytochrome c oxidase cbb3-type subunit 1